MQEISDKWISETDVFKITGRSVYALRADRSKGRGMPYTKLGAQVRYKVLDVHNYMNAKRVDPEGVSNTNS